MSQANVEWAGRQLLLACLRQRSRHRLGCCLFSFLCLFRLFRVFSVLGVVSLVCVVSIVGGRGRRAASKTAASERSAGSPRRALISRSASRRRGGPLRRPASSALLPLKTSD